MPGVFFLYKNHQIAGMNVQERATEIEEEFDFLDDWEVRYAHIIDLGKSNPPLLPEERNEITKVRGCASQVWMVISPEDGDRLNIRAESDAMIVSGLVVLLTRLFSGATRADIKAFDTSAFFERIGVTGTLSAQRSNGLASMLMRIKQTASAPAPAAPAA